jgi:tetratricopeptide (TPR) repeat protein
LLNRPITALAVFVTAAVLRLTHVWQMRDTLFFSVLMGDSRGYDAWAQQLAAGDWIGRDVFYQAPLYPYFLGAIYALFGRDLFVVRIIQALLGALSCVAVGYAATRLISARAGLAAGLMLALYPPAIFFDGLLQKSVLDVFFVCLSLALVARIVEHGEQRVRGGRGGGTEAQALRAPRWWLALGLAMGALALTRENALALIVVVAVWAATVSTKDTKDTKDTGTKGTGENKTRDASFVPSVPVVPAVLVVPVVSFLIGVILVLLPVAARNYSVAGGLYLTTSQFGSNLYIGNHPGADGSYVGLRAGRGSPEYERLDATELAEEASGRRLTPGEVSSYWTGKVLAYVVSQPVEWLRLLARKARLLASSTEIIDTESQESHAEYSWLLRLLGPVWHFGVLLPLAVIGVAGLWPRRRRLWPLYALAVAYAASVVLFFVVARYRLPLVPMIVLFAASGVVPLIDAFRDARVKSARRSGLRGPALMALLLAIVANWPLRTAASQQAITENNLGAALQESGRVDEAIARYRRALALQPGYTPAMNNLGTALRATGRVDEAVAVYEHALSAKGGSATMHVNRGNALMTQGRVADAIAAFRQAVALDPRSEHASTALAHALYDQGTAAIEAGAFDAAIAALREAIALKRDYAEAHNNLAIALASQGNLRDAIRHWEEALKLAPGLDDARRNLERAQRRNE